MAESEDVIFGEARQNLQQEAVRERDEASSRDSGYGGNPLNVEVVVHCGS